MVLGEEHPDTLTSMANLAFTWKDQDRHADALALMMECVQVLQQVLCLVHPIHSIGHGIGVSNNEANEANLSFG